MKRNFSIIFLVLIWNLCHSQHSERFLELVNDLEEISCKTDTTYYKNGNINWIICWTTYIYNSEEYSTGTGRMIHYYKNGQIASESYLGKYGNTLSWNGFDRNGNKTIESVTTEIDSDAKNLNEFFDSPAETKFKRYNRLYKCSGKLGNCYLYKEGKRVNGKKNGIWTTYYANGEIKKEKEY
ncbi:hypothetical protein [Formosa algae]|uniref:Antitoxin component YwqK of YwqJK toxin-antitoxin module n=1 Tax=Formosa algae TaxID=225843 RepID=A0A9X0YQ72_9FLAO|nr:hypothetical protein [Formosa algae]MBP1841724.1 antitoxin component YwqK of YwqJK toxin-antitoxin module [Formosa algae]MDQ0337202.1 antitoxin component YwqK of YwqJK toxin-antitoxin module [Formosa algae]OEI79531.1 hypothetical protein AST99_13995 [Formosa algae]PNW25662.1 hypothetical protein BKP44_19385 [Formosa algae]